MLRRNRKLVQINNRIESSPSEHMSREESFNPTLNTGSEASTSQVTTMPKRKNFTKTGPRQSPVLDAPTSAPLRLQTPQVKKIG